MRYAGCVLCITSLSIHHHSHEINWLVIGSAHHYFPNADTGRHPVPSGEPETPVETKTCQNSSSPRQSPAVTGSKSQNPKQTL